MVRRSGSAGVILAVAKSPKELGVEVGESPGSGVGPDDRPLPPEQAARTKAVVNNVRRVALERTLEGNTLKITYR